MDSEFSESIRGGQAPVVVGGYAALAALATVRTAQELKPAAAESVKLLQETLVETGSAALPLTLEMVHSIRGVQPPAARVSPQEATRSSTLTIAFCVSGPTV